MIPELCQRPGLKHILKTVTAGIHGKSSRSRKRQTRSNCFHLIGINSEKRRKDPDMTANWEALFLVDKPKFQFKVVIVFLSCSLKPPRIQLLFRNRSTIIQLPTELSNSIFCSRLARGGYQCHCVYFETKRPEKRCPCSLTYVDRICC